MTPKEKEQHVWLEPDSLPVLACYENVRNMMMCHRDNGKIFFEIVIDNTHHRVYPAQQQIENFNRELGEWINERNDCN